MRFGALTTAFASPALPLSGYDFRRAGIDDLDALLVGARARPTAEVVVAVSMLEIIEVPAESTVYLFTRDGHFAHRAVVVRRIVQSQAGPTLETFGYTTARDEAMTTWLAQFKEGDAAVRVSSVAVGEGRP